MGFANIGALSSPPIGGLIYSQAGVVGVAAVSLDVLILDLIMQILLIEKKFAVRYYLKISESVNESFARTTNGSHIKRQEGLVHSEENPIFNNVDTSHVHLFNPQRTEF